MTFVLHAQRKGPNQVYAIKYRKSAKIDFYFEISNKIEISQDVSYGNEYQYSGKTAYGCAKRK